MEGRDVTPGSGGEQGTRPFARHSTAGLVQQARELPNVLSLLRLAAVPVFVWAMLAGRHVLALVLFVSAALTDIIDGLLARMLDKRTRLGEILDPVADKLLTLAVLATLAVAGALPLWLLGLVLVRDGGIALAALWLRLSGRVVPASPTRLGKYATFFLAATATLAFARLLDGGERLDAPVAVFGLVAAECVVAAIVQYFVRWRRLMLSPP